MEINLMNYFEKNSVLLSVILIMAVCMIGIWNMYRKQKRRADRVSADVREERNFYKDYSETEECCYIYIRKSDHAVLFVSPNFEPMTGISVEAFRRDMDVVRNIVSGSELRKLQKQLEHWDKTELFAQEVPYHQKGQGEQRMAKLLIRPITSGEVYLLTLRNVTREYSMRLRLEEGLEQARKESQEKTNFLSKMSHEIRTPMNGILGMLSLAKSHSDQPDMTVEYLEKAENLSQFLLQLINDILDMSRIESGKMKLEQEPFDLLQLGEKLDNMFRGTAEGKGIHWQVQMQDFTVRYVIGDEMRLSQVVINFISNATKFTPTGGDVCVTFRQMDILDGMLHLMIRVRDTGKGIRKDFVEKIFRPFEQEDASTARNYGGSGLGMAIADNMVRLMNGQILVESQEGKGTEFTVYLTLPVAQDMEMQNVDAPEQTVELSDADREEALNAFTLEGLHILLAEDNDINAEIALEILEMQGAVLERANNGKQALERFAQSAPGTYDVILMDIQMPEMDGWEATKAIRALNRSDADLPIFAMSANAFVEDQRHSMEVGMNGHINKPINFDEVRRMIGAYMLRSN